ncbi:MAG TPA: XRE family transcriptional regulator [Amaricoccus sp.]|uniref:helix-turn-helix domain-containing protein n=1 Tax=Amaricoccus sp. TaxID=1872485 RepID=UPI002C67D079|nr:XRE family transcriptional regulator [Amaricoccus sp.]HMQ92997.1 XRE family transcriptional regulator [Amaricoccus sp.]HMR51914.1 XRE family transcriptional regulator [Amaricoccus sp.]HMR61020.1 XRE family transcriptional regulator [Amaricoccus sp.]HMT98716.1 XRE family transcriptional regulator [Amaricoccus sp.]
MVSETLADELGQYRIGPKVRALRRARKLGLVQLGEHTGLSPGMLSKIERGQVFPTLPTLLRIAMVFGVGLDHFFADASARRTLSVVRRQDRLRLPERSGATAPAYFFESLNFPAADRLIDAYLAVFPARGPSSDPHRHDGAELVFVLAGQVAVTVGETEVLLAEGDALYFDPAVPHRYGGFGSEDATALVVVTAGGPAAETVASAAAP